MDRTSIELSSMQPSSSSDSAVPQTLDPALRRRLGAAFAGLGLANNTIYVIILSAALDLAADVPKGVVLFCNIAPALIAKLGWPYLLRGRVRYAKRIISCTALFITGVLVVALSTALHTRLFGISLASFAGGLGEMTILQLASTLSREDQVSNYAVGWFSSGTGAAGFVGAGLWWFLRALGVRLGLSLTAIIPLGYCAAYFLLLPRQQLKAQRKQSYKPVAQEDDDAEVDVEDPEHSQTQAAFLGSAPLSMQSKLDIARPLLLRFMLPLFSVYFAEYTINQGVSPDLLYPVPTKEEAPLFSHLIHKLSDYYPLWQLAYQTLVFVARSSTVLFGMPVLPTKLIYLPSMLQVCLLFLLALEAEGGWLESLTGGSIRGTLLLLIAFEGLLGGYAYVSTFSRLSSTDEETEDGLDHAVAVARKEFRMG